MKTSFNQSIQFNTLQIKLNPHIYFKTNHLFLCVLSYHAKTIAIGCLTTLLWTRSDNLPDIQKAGQWEACALTFEMSLFEREAAAGKLSRGSAGLLLPALWPEYFNITHGGEFELWEVNEEERTKDWNINSRDLVTSVKWMYVLAKILKLSGKKTFTLIFWNKLT